MARPPASAARVALYLRRARLIDSLRLRLRSPSSPPPPPPPPDDPVVALHAIRAAPTPASAVSIFRAMPPPQPLPLFQALASRLAAFAALPDLRSHLASFPLPPPPLARLRLLAVAGDHASALDAFASVPAKPHRPAEAHNLLMGLHVRAADHAAAVEAFRAMVLEGALPNARTYTVIIEHLASAGFVDQAVEVFRLIPSLRARRTTRQYNVLTVALASAGKFELLRWLVREMVAVDGVMPGPQMRAAIAAMREAGYTEGTEDFLEELSPNERIGYAVDDAEGEGGSDDEEEDDDDGAASRDKGSGRATLKPWLDPRELARALEGWEPREVAELEAAGIVWTPRLVCKLLRAFKKAETAWEFFCWVACRPGGYAHDRHTVARMVAILARAGHVELVERLLSKVRADGIVLPFATVRLVVDFYGLSKKADAAIRVFREADSICGSVSRPNLMLLCSSLLRTLAKCRRGPDAMELLEEMMSRGVLPDLQTFSGLMEHLANTGDLKGVHRLLGLVRQCELQPDGYMYSVLIRAYCKKERAALALKLFDEMRGAGVAPDAPTKALLVKSLWREGKLREAAQVEERCEETAGGGLPEASPGHVWTASAADLKKVSDIYYGCFTQPAARTRQYFEQKKRQQQRSGVQSQVDVAGTGSQAYHDQAPRSLDVINLNNLATPISHSSGPENVDNVVPPLDCTLLSASPIEGLKKITSACSNLKEPSSQPRLSSSSDHQDGAASANPYEEPLSCKIPPPKSNSVKKKIPNVELNNGDVSFPTISRLFIIGLLVQKFHFLIWSVMRDQIINLLHDLPVKLMTLPLPPKVMRYTQNKARRYIPFDATKQLDSIINDINVLKERRFSEKRTCPLDESGYERSKQSNCYFPHSFENHNNKFFPEDEDMFCEPQAEEGIPATHDLFSDNSLVDNGNDTVLFDWERHPPIKKKSNLNSTFGPSAWSFDMVDDSEKRRSPRSEESCSSAAVMKDGSCKKPPLSVECEENKMNEKDDFHISFDNLDIPKMDAHLDGISLSDNLEEHRKRIDDQNNLEAGYWSDKATEKQRTREPSCRLSLKEKFSNWGSTSPTAHRKGGTGLSNPSSCTVLHEDKPFNSSSEMSTYQTAGSKVSPVFHRPDNAIFDDDIHLQSSVSDIFGDRIEFSKPNCSMGLQSDIDMSTFLAEKVDKRKEDNFDTSKNRSEDMFFANKSVSSVRQNVGGQHRSCPQQPGKDSLLQGFSPGIDFQDSRLHSFWEDDHADNGTFQGDIELSDLLTRKNTDKNEDRIEKLSKPETKMLTEAYADHRNEMRETETCSDGSEVTNPPGVQKQMSLAAQVPANLSCLQETSREMLKVHAHAECVKKEKIENPCVDFSTPFHLRNKIPDVDHSKSNFMFHSPFVGEEVGIEKKIIASVSPNNSDVQYKVMLEHRVLRRLCVQKIVVDTPIKNKLDKDNHFRMMEDGYHVLPRSV
uniref:Pentatricopeptide repeat-containing protein n=1 Tax=Oryza punctata TaxID=4537 RepID=A0A0E0JEJ4_ORYPU